MTMMQASVLRAVHDLIRCPTSPSPDGHTDPSTVKVVVTPTS